MIVSLFHSINHIFIKIAINLTLFNTNENIGQRYDRGECVEGNCSFLSSRHRLHGGDAPLPQVKYNEVHTVDSFLSLTFTSLLIVTLILLHSYLCLLSLLS